jgi:hypothetical protein
MQMPREPKESLELRLLREQPATAARAVGLLIASKSTASIEYLEAEDARSLAWDKLREALGLAQVFGE